MNRSPVFDILPGIDTPVAEVRNALDAVWDGDGPGGKPDASEYRASQANLILHFGLDTTAEYARDAFQSAVHFSRRYPCRTLALCPRKPGGGGDVLAKIFCECYIGKSQKDMTCSEAIVLTYPLEERVHLQDQVSIMFESDLPIYYWPQHISRASRLGDYKLFLKEARRVVLDSAIEKPEVAEFQWPRPETVRDLAFARILPVRQSIGHFASYIAPETLVKGLAACRLKHRPGLGAEAAALLKWSREALVACAETADSSIDGIAFEHTEDMNLGATFDFEWTYKKSDGVKFTFDFETGSACLESSLSGEKRALTSVVKLLAPEAALAEALFFG